MSNAIKCHNCGRVVGTLVERNANTFLRIDTSAGSVTVYRVHGYCQCGAQIHWDSSDVRLQRLLKRARRDIITETDG